MQTAWIIKSTILNTKLCDSILLMWITSNAQKFSCQWATEEIFHCGTYSCSREKFVHNSYTEYAYDCRRIGKETYVFQREERNSSERERKKAWHFKNDENKSITFECRKEAYIIISDYFRKLTWTNKERKRERVRIFWVIIVHCKCVYLAPC